MQTKKCIECGEEKSLDDFVTHNKAKDGKGSYCKVCQRAYTKQWVKDNKEHVQQTRKVYNQENKERNAKQSKIYRGTHKEYFAEKNKEFNKNNPEKILLYEARKRAKKFDLPCTLKHSDIVIPEFCPILGIKLERGVKDNNRDCAPSLDRILPQFGYVKENVAVMSYRANRLKNDGSVEEIEKLLTWLKSVTAA